MTATELDDVLAKIVAKAKALRDSGVVGRVTIADVSFELAEPEPPQAATQAAAVAEPDPLNDPDLYGGYIPQRRSPEPRPEDQE